MEWNANSLCFLSECLTNSNRNSPPWEIENHPLLQIKWLEFIVYISKWLKRVAVEHDYDMLCYESLWQQQKTFLIKLLKNQWNEVCYLNEHCSDTLHSDWASLLNWDKQLSAEIFFSISLCLFKEWVSKVSGIWQTWQDCTVRTNKNMFNSLPQESDMRWGQHSLQLHVPDKNLANNVSTLPNIAQTDKTCKLSLLTKSQLIKASTSWAAHVRLHSLKMKKIFHIFCCQ